MKIAKQYIRIMFVFAISICVPLCAQEDAINKQQVYGQALYERTCAILDESDGNAQKAAEKLIRTIMADPEIDVLLNIGKNEGFTVVELLTFAKTIAQENEDQEVVQILQNVQEEEAKSWFSKHPIVTTVSAFAVAAGSVVAYFKPEVLKQLFSDCLTKLGFGVQVVNQPANEPVPQTEAERLAAEQARIVAEQEAQRIATQDVEARRTAEEQSALKLAQQRQKEQEDNDFFVNAIAQERAKGEAEAIKAEQDEARKARFTVIQKENEDADFWANAFAKERAKQEAEQDVKPTRAEMLAKIKLAVEQESVPLTEAERLAAEQELERIDAELAEKKNELAAGEQKLANLRAEQKALKAAELERVLQNDKELREKYQLGEQLNPKNVNPGIAEEESSDDSATNSENGAEETNSTDSDTPDQVPVNSDASVEDSSPDAGSPTANLGSSNTDSENGAEETGSTHSGTPELAPVDLVVHSEEPQASEVASEETLTNPKPQRTNLYSDSEWSDLVAANEGVYLEETLEEEHARIAAALEEQFVSASTDETDSEGEIVSEEEVMAENQKIIIDSSVVVNTATEEAVEDNEQQPVVQEDVQQDDQQQEENPAAVTEVTSEFASEVIPAEVVEQVADNTQQPGAQEDAPVDTNASVLPDDQQPQVNSETQQAAEVDDPSLFI